MHAFGLSLGTFVGLVNTSDGRILAVKPALASVLLGLAGANRWFFCAVCTETTTATTMDIELPVIARLPVLNPHCIGLFHRNGATWSIAAVDQARSF